jgi:multidrug transporter EmrE-like cation transporter
MTAYYYLAIAICAEVIATVSMKAVKGLSTPMPLLLVIVGYGVAFWMLTLVVRSVPVGVAYAVWAGMGIVMVSVARCSSMGRSWMCRRCWAWVDRAGRGGDSVVLENRRALTARKLDPGQDHPLSLYTWHLVLNTEVAHAIRYFHRRSDCRRWCRRPLAECAPAPPGVFDRAGGNASLGGGQAKSQGIIHGGAKYALHGA